MITLILGVCIVVFEILGVIIGFISLTIIFLALYDEFKWAKESGREAFHENSGKWQPGAQIFLIFFIFIAIVLLGLFPIKIFIG